MHHLSFFLPPRRLVLAVASVVVCAIGVGVLTGAGGEASTTAAYPYYIYPGPPCDPYNGPPHAAFNYSPVSPKPGQEVTFTSTSTDPDGDPLLTGWDFNGDWNPTLANRYEGIDQTGDVAHFTYSAPGDYRVRMGVEEADPCRAFDIIDMTVRVEPGGDGGTGGGAGAGGGSVAGGAAQDRTGPKIVVPRVNKTRRVSRAGVFTFILGPFAEDVSGTIRFESVAAVVSQGRRMRKLKLRTKAISAARGQRLVVRTKLPRKGRQALRRRKRIQMRARIVLRDTIGNASTRSFVFTLKPRKTKR